MLIIAYFLASIVCYLSNANVSSNQGYNDGNNFTIIHIELPKGPVVSQTVEIIALALLGECTFKLLQYVQKAILMCTRNKRNQDESAKEIGRHENCVCRELLQNDFAKASAMAPEDLEQDLAEEWEEYWSKNSEWAAESISEEDESESYSDPIESSQTASTTFGSFRTPLSPIYEDPAEEPNSPNGAQEQSEPSQRLKSKRK